ncbi:MAG: GNAT family protein [Candidatus Pacearchaeota archaeon]
MKIIIRKAKPGDEKGIAENFNDGLKRGFFCYTGSNKPFDKEKIKKLRKSFLKPEKNECSVVAIDKETNKIVGSALFSGKKEGRLRHRVEFGWGVNPDYANKGIGTKMVRFLLNEAKKRGFKKAQAEVAVKNFASIKLAKKCGFKIEGKRKAGLICDDGKYVDTYIFGKILK